jgi:hypothetical protein
MAAVRPHARAHSQELRGASRKMHTGHTARKKCERCSASLFLVRLTTLSKRPRSESGCLFVREGSRTGRHGNLASCPPVLSTPAQGKARQGKARGHGRAGSHGCRPPSDGRVSRDFARSRPRLASQELFRPLKLAVSSSMYVATSIPKVRACRRLAAGRLAGARADTRLRLLAAAVTAAVPVLTVAASMGEDSDRARITVTRLAQESSGLKSSSSSESLEGEPIWAL